MKAARFQNARSVRDRPDCGSLTFVWFVSKARRKAGQPKRRHPFHFYQWSEIRYEQLLAGICDDGTVRKDQD